MKVIIATANTKEPWEDWSHQLGVFASVDVFEKWLRENFIVDAKVKNTLKDKFLTYHIFNKNSITDGSSGGDYYEVYIEDGEECKYIDVGEFVKLQEFEVIE